MSGDDHFIRPDNDQERECSECVFPNICLNQGRCLLLEEDVKALENHTMVTDHDMRMEALRLFEENERLYRKLREIHDITQDTTLHIECWQKLQNIAATAASALSLQTPHTIEKIEDGA